MLEETSNEKCKFCVFVPSVINKCLCTLWRETLDLEMVIVAILKVITDGVRILFDQFAPDNCAHELWQVVGLLLLHRLQQPFSKGKWLWPKRNDNRYTILTFHTSQNGNRRSRAPSCYDFIYIAALLMLYHPRSFTDYAKGKYKPI